MFWPLGMRLRVRVSFVLGCDLGLGLGLGLESVCFGIGDATCECVG